MTENEHGFKLEDDSTILYYMSKSGELKEVKFEYKAPTPEEIKQMKLEATNKLHKLSLFKSELTELYKKHGIAIGYDCWSNEFEFNNYSHESTYYVLNEIDNEIKRLQNTIGEN